MPEATGKSKFEQVRDRIRDQILMGEYGDGDELLPEEELAGHYKVSRVTIRKALEGLKSDQIVTSVRGSGTRVTLRKGGYQGALDMVVLVAPTYDPFLSEFLQEFETIAAKHGTMVVFKHDGRRGLMESPESYRRFLDRGIHDFVLWPGRGFVDEALLRRLRGLGINVVLFDHHIETVHADTVQLDNQDAIAILLGKLAPHSRRMDYIGWSDVPLSSTTERESAFRERARPGDRTFRIPKRPAGREAVHELLDRLRRERSLPEALVCVNADLGGWVAAYLKDHDLLSIRVACIDELSPIEGMEFTCVRQPLDRMAHRVFACLRQQNEQGARWLGRRHQIKGTLLEVGATRGSGGA